MNRRVLPRIAALMVSMLWLQSCAHEPPALPPMPMVLPAPAASPTEDRRPEIVKQLRAICPQTMTAAELEAAADYLEAHPDALVLVRRLDLFDRQSRICRGEKP